MKCAALARSLPAACLLASLSTPLPAQQADPTGNPRLGLPDPPHAAPDSPARLALGRKLFMDRRLSRNDTMSCGMCHVPEQAFTVNELATSIGIEGRSLRRNAPSVLNVGFASALFHDGRAATLEEQAWAPLLAADEMGNPDRQTVVGRIAGLPDYAGMFERAFDGAPPSPHAVAAALAAYQRSLVSGGSRFDRWQYGGEPDALTPEEQRGFALFRGKARCSACHTVERTHALFTDQRFHNTGLGAVPARREQGSVRVELEPGVATALSRELLNRLFGAAPGDLGRFEVTGASTDRFAFRTPTLRNIALTAPYMHNGSLATLPEVVEFYDRGGGSDPQRDRLLMPLLLSASEKQELVALLRALTGSNVEWLAAEARAAASTPRFLDGARSHSASASAATAAAVLPSESRCGLYSATSAATRRGSGSSAAMPAIASCNGMPPGTGVPVPGASIGSSASRSKLKPHTAVRAVARATASLRQSANPRARTSSMYMTRTPKRSMSAASPAS